MASERVICIDAKAKATFSKQYNALCKLVEMVLTLSRLHPSVTSQPDANWEVRFARQKMALHVRVTPAAKAHASTVSFIARPDAFGLPDGRSAKGLSRHLRTRACRDIDAEKSTNPTLLVLVVLNAQEQYALLILGRLDFGASAGPCDRQVYSSPLNGSRVSHSVPVRLPFCSPSSIRDRPSIAHTRAVVGRTR